MMIETLHINPYAIPLTTGQERSGILIGITDAKGNRGWGDIAPLPQWSRETLEDSLKQLDQKQAEILKIVWTARTCFDELAKLKLLPAVSFGLESALLRILTPLSEYSVPVSALIMGSYEEILKQAELRLSEGYTTAKLKVSNLSFDEASKVIHLLKDKFRLRIDVNRAWSTSESLRFFSKFPLNTFDYVEEPFQNPQDLAKFPHPLAVDESFPGDLSLEQLELLPTLKALIYKPTIQGGMLNCLPLHEWTTKKGISLVLSSSFESDLGLANIASIAHRLSISTPTGIGTYDFLKTQVSTFPLKFSESVAHIPAKIIPQEKFLKGILK